MPTVHLTSGCVCPFQFHSLQKGLVSASKGDTQLLHISVIRSHLVLYFNYEDPYNFKAIYIAYVFLLSHDLLSFTLVYGDCSASTDIYVTSFYLCEKL